MPNPYITQAPQVLLPDQAEQTQIMRQRRLAEVLQQQGMEAPQGQMVSGIYVAPSITQYLAQGLKGYLGSKGMSDADERQKALAEALAQRQQDWMAQMPTAKQTEQYGITETGEPMGPPQTVTQQPTSEDYLSWGMRGMQINPQMAQFGVSMADKAETRRAATELRKDTLEAQERARKETLEAQERLRKELQEREIEARRAAAAERQAADERMARLTASLRPEPMVTVLDTASGMPVQVTRSQAAGMTPFNAQTAKLQQQMKQKEQAVVPIQGALNQAATVFAHPGKETGTGRTAWMQNIPSTDARAFGANLNTLKAQSFLSAVESMRGLGALTEAEGKKLVDSVGALDPYQRTEDFDTGLKGAARFLYNKAKASGINVTLPEFATEGGRTSSGKIGAKGDVLQAADAILSGGR